MVKVPNMKMSQTKQAEGVREFTQTKTFTPHCLPRWMSTELPIRHTKHFQQNGKRENEGEWSEGTVRANTCSLMHLSSSRLLSQPQRSLTSQGKRIILLVTRYVQQAETGLKPLKCPNMLDQPSPVKPAHLRRQQASESKKCFIYCQMLFNFVCLIWCTKPLISFESGEADGCICECVRVCVSLL